MIEQEAVDRLRRGDIGGLEFLVRKYQLRAVRAAFLITHDVALAQDVVQAAFLKAYERIDQFDSRRAFAPWFFTSVMRDAIKAVRAQGRHISIQAISGDDSPDAIDLSDHQPSPEQVAERAETAQEVWAALDRLTPDQRAAVVARYYLGLSEAETATTLTLSLTTVKWRLHVARKRLRSFLSSLAKQEV